MQDAINTPATLIKVITGLGAQYQRKMKSRTFAAQNSANSALDKHIDRLYNSYIKRLWVTVDTGTLANASVD